MNAQSYDGEDELPKQDNDQVMDHTLPTDTNITSISGIIIISGWNISDGNYSIISYTQIGFPTNTVTKNVTLVSYETVTNNVTVTETETSETPVSIIFFSFGLFITGLIIRSRRKF
ncbi:MAG: hypothetical protein ACXAD7_10255 [Candidatus Kariarchaeaceae archaeon]|jgi:hypothetical protein